MNLSHIQLIRGNRNFRNLLWGQLVSETGTWFNFVAGLGIVRLVSGASPEAAGLLLLLQTLPFAALMPIVGAVVDRFSRKMVLIVSDLVRAGFALLFLLVTGPEDLWIAYVAAALLSGSTAFFEGAKNAAMPNITGKEGLLSGTSLLYSTRFLLMAVGGALGGFAAVYFGYKVAFLINAGSFLVSAVSIWLIPSDAMRERSPEERIKDLEEHPRPGFFKEIGEGMRYAVRNPFALTFLMLNIIWASGGGATNMVFEGLGTKVFSDEETSPDFVYSFLLTFNGIGLAAGMLIAHRVGSFVERRKIIRGFMGWTLVVHGLVFAAAGQLPYLWMVAVMVMISRLLIGAEYAVQETLLQRSLPDKIRGRILTLDRGAEITVYSLSAYAGGVALTMISAQSLTLIAGLLAASSGLVWLVRSRGKGHDVENPEQNAS